ncbi:MAG TPA: aldehyde dehydrogenase family protein [Methanospirillum sp.]|uniref:aldehyde dehydrogenase family protein n=1 Tax=Methanospirillum sp. TaxID=45200 RepID=UPI002D1991DC|nr:aldehyde dehydrogenase family protein [Methanospirillum sp.]HWQ64682.1 aldehyde dehydrogenase family protein [Methanospirillum sp.]
MDDWACIVGGVERRSDDRYLVVNPFSGEAVGQVSRSRAADIEDALQAATAGSAETADLAAHQRAAVLRRLADLMSAHREEFITLLIAEGGKPRRNAEGETARAIETILISAEEAVRICGEVIPLDRTLPGEGCVGIVQRFPVGVVLGITPFNFPLNLACHKLGPAVASGNAIILKPASATPLSSLLLGRLLVEAGYPPAAVSVLICRPDEAEMLAADQRIGCLSFTGSPDVGWHLRSRATYAKVTLELGGNGAVIVHEDCDLSRVAFRIIEGGFSQAGQVCISVQRVFVHRPLFEPLLSRLSELTDALVVGDPSDPKTDVGSMISKEAAEHALKRIQDACSGGATLVKGGSLSGALLQPTILTGTKAGMEVNCREVFAPIITVTPYDTFEQAVAEVNDSVYGLQAGVFTRDLLRARYAFSHLKVGTVVIGDIPTFRVDIMPYGGVKRSGCGREGPRYAIEEMTDTRMMIIRDP